MTDRGTEISEAQIAVHWQEEEKFPPTAELYRSGEHDGCGYL